MEQRNEKRTTSGTSHANPANEISNGQDNDEQEPRGDETGGGQLTKLKENAARNHNLEHGASSDDE